MDRAGIIRAWLRGKGAVELAESFHVPESDILQLLAVTRLVNPRVAPGVAPEEYGDVDSLASAVDAEYAQQRQRAPDLTWNLLSNRIARLRAIFRTFPALSFEEFTSLLDVAKYSGLDETSLRRFLAFVVATAPWTHAGADANWTRDTEKEWAALLAPSDPTPSITLDEAPEAATGTAHRITKLIATQQQEHTERADMSAYLGIAPDAVLVEMEKPFRAFEIRQVPFLIGRTGEAALVIADDAVSRSHAVITREGEHLVLEDKQSSNGTYLNGRQIKRAQLQRGDHLQIGYKQLRFYNGMSAELAVREEIYSNRIRDPLTQVMTARLFAERLESECERADHTDGKLSLVLVELDGLKTANELFTKDAGDGLLREVATRLSAQLPVGALVSRRPAGFAVLLPELDERAVWTYIESWSGIEVIEVNQRSLHPRLRTGIAHRQPGRRRSEDLAGAGELALSISRMCDDDAPTVAPMSTSGKPGPVHSGETLIHRVLADHSPRRLVAFTAVGSEHPRNWREVLALVSSSLVDGEWLGSIKQRYLLVATPDGDRTDSLAAVLSAAAAKLGATFLRVVVMPEEVRQLGLRVLDVIPERLIPAAPAALQVNDRIGSLPFTVAAPIAHIAMAENLDRRFDAARFALERSLSFVVGTQLSVLRKAGTKQQWSDVAGKLRLSNSKSISMGKWVELASTLSQQLHGLGLKGPALALTRFASPTGSRTAIANRLESVTTVRNQQAHGRPQGQDEVNEAVIAMMDALRQLQQSLLPLSEARLISQQGIRRERRDGTTEYSVREHVGASEVFTVVNQQFRHKLFEREWCYFDRLLGDEPVLLAPWVYSSRCPRCDRNEVFVAPTLNLNEQGDEIDLRGVTTDHELTVTVPDDPELAAFMSAVLK